MSTLDPTRFKVRAHPQLLWDAAPATFQDMMALQLSGLGRKFGDVFVAGLSRLFAAWQPPSRGACPRAARGRRA